MYPKPQTPTPPSNAADRQECCTVGRLQATHYWSTPALPVKETDDEYAEHPAFTVKHQLDSPASCHLTSDWRKRWAPPAGRSLDHTLYPGDRNSRVSHSFRLPSEQMVYCIRDIQITITHLLHICLVDIHGGNLLFHHIPKVLCWTEMW
ncbi:hypothetical protein ILYODFUR_034484 [Ilyodon furcidens]|uniref:Uncharacterized protein n=1 Tax=Ilyodon furcidens TaxID=33524 RepID=A0ABV0SRW8_9TELE